MQKRPSIEQRDDGTVYLRVKVQPRASHEAIQYDSNGAIRISLTAPPVDDAANTALTALVAKRLHIPKSAITIRVGHKSREKTLVLTGVTPEFVRERLS